MLTCDLPWYSRIQISAPQSCALSSFGLHSLDAPTLRSDLFTLFVELPVPQGKNTHTHKVNTKVPCEKYAANIHLLTLIRSVGERTRAYSMAAIHSSYIYIYILHSLWANSFRIYRQIPSNIIFAFDRLHGYITIQWYNATYLAFSSPKLISLELRSVKLRARDCEPRTKKKNKCVARESSRFCAVK